MTKTDERVIFEDTTGVVTEQATKSEHRWQVIRERIAAGLCRDCGEPRGADGSPSRCKRHATARRLYMLAYRQRHPEHPRRRTRGAAGIGTPNGARRRATDSPAAPYVTPKGRVLILRATKLDTPPPFADPAWRATHWRCRITSTAGRAMTTTFSMGAAYDGVAPTAVMVLGSLAVEARALSTHAEGGFEAWCAEYGLNADSRRIEQVYRLTKRNTAALRRLLGKEAEAVIAALADQE